MQTGTTLYTINAAVIALLDYCSEEGQFRQCPKKFTVLCCYRTQYATVRDLGVKSPFYTKLKSWPHPNTFLVYALLGCSLP